MSIAQPPTLPTDSDRLLERGRKLSRRGDPVWELALSHPRQGEWTETDYLRLTETESVELVDGCLEFLPMATLFHQRIALWLRDRLVAYLQSIKSRGLLPNS